jgi:hypothetical protein
MKKASALIVVVVILALVGFYVADKNKTIDTAQDNKTLVYANSVYGFSFEIPEGYEYNKYTEEIISVGHKTEGGFDSSAEVQVSMSGGEGGYQSFDAFLFDSTKNMCAADGPRETIYCDRIIQEQPFETSLGLSGTVFYQNRVTKNLETGEEETDAFGPIFAFNIQANTPGSKFSALIVRAPSNLRPADVNSELIRQIAESIKIDKIGQR